MSRKSLASTLILALGAGLFFLGKPARSEGGPRSLLRYRHPIERLSLETQIRLMEERVAREEGKSGIDLAALGGLYVEAAKENGRAEWWEKARNAAERSLQALPVANPGAKNVQAQIALAEHDFEGAVKLADELIACGRGVGEGLAIRVTAELATGNLLQAEKDADAAVAKRPTLSSLTQRGLVYEAMGRDSEAMEDWLSGLMLEDLGEVRASAWTRTLIGRAHLRHGRLEEAKEWLLEARRLCPEHPITVGLLADIAGREGDPKEADRLYEEALLLSGDPSYLSREGRMRDLAGDRAGALNAWEGAEKLLRLQLAEGKTGHRLELARILLLRGRAAEAPEALTLLEAEVAHRRSAPALDLYAGALGANGRWGEAREAVREALDTGLKSAELYLRAAQVADALGDPGRAHFYRDLARSTDPSNPELTAASPRG